MIDVLIVNSTQIHCGVYQYGLNIANNILKYKSDKFKYHYVELASKEDLWAKARLINPTMFIFNWHPTTMAWLQYTELNKFKRNIFICHEYSVHDYNVLNPIINVNPGIKVDGVFSFSTGRCLYQFTPNEPPISDNIVGSFGFGFGHKRFKDIVSLVNKEFDKALIRLHIPLAYFGDSDGKQARLRVDECRSIAKPGIEIDVSHRFMSIPDLLTWLSENSINVLLYEKVITRGVSSAVDFLLSAKRPIAISDSDMFMHIRKPEIILDPLSSNTICQIRDRGLSPLTEYYDKWSSDRFVQEFDGIVDKIYMTHPV